MGLYRDLEKGVDIDWNEHLSYVLCGDQNNSQWFHHYVNTPEKAKKDFMLVARDYESSFGLLQDMIYEFDIDRNMFRRAVKIITVIKGITQLETYTGDFQEEDADLLYFSLLVNYYSGLNKSSVKIKSISEARTIFVENGGEVDYREYAMNNANSEKTQNSTITIPLVMEQFSKPINVTLPIVKMKFGFFRFSTERRVGNINIEDDDVNVIIPASEWLSVVAQANANRHRNVYAPFERKGLPKTLEFPPKDIQVWLKKSGYKADIKFPIDYDVDITSDGFLAVYNVEDVIDLPELDSDKYDWKKVGNKFMLIGSKPYLVYQSEYEIQIMTA